MVISVASSAVIWSEDFETGDLGAFTDCPTNPESPAWLATDESEVFSCGTYPCEGSYYAMGDSSGWYAPDKIDIMWAGPIDLSGANGKLEAQFCYIVEYMMLFGDELHFYATCTNPIAPCEPAQWTDLWSIEATSVCLQGTATVDMTPVVGCTVCCNQLWIGFG